MKHSFLPSSVLRVQSITIRSWFCQLLFIGLLTSTALDANAQTKWTQQIQTRPHTELKNIAYGAGRYVAVGTTDLIRVSTDGIAWKTQMDDSNQGFLKTDFKDVIYAKNQFVAVGSSGDVSMSVDGLTWAKTAMGTEANMNKIAYGNGLYMAVGQLGAAFTSPDGMTWTSCTTGTTTNFNDLVYAGGRFVAVGDDGMIRTTPNGIIWTERQSGTTMNLKGIAFSPTGNLVAIGPFNLILTSVNGITWKKQEYVYYPAGTYLYYSSIYYNSILGKFVLIIGGTKDDLLTSVDGNNWLPSSTDSEIPIARVRYENGQLMAVGTKGRIGYSSDGLNWKWPIVEKFVNLYGVAYGNGRYVAVGEYPSEENRSLRANIALTSADGQHYGVGETVHLASSSKCFYDVVFGAGQFVAVGEDAIIQTSTDGKVWSKSSVTYGQKLRVITYGAGWFIAVGNNGFFCRSTDGKAWLQGFIGQPHDYNSLAYANGLFVAVSESGVIATSSNGLLWTERDTKANAQIKSVAYGNGMWVAVGYGGLVCWSLDGVNWLHYTADPTARFNHIVFANGQFVAVSLDGKLYTAPSAFGWKPRQSTVPFHLFGLTHGPGQFVAVGQRSTNDDLNQTAIITSPDANPATTQSLSPNPNSQARLAAEEIGPEVRLQAVAYPNPVEEQFNLTIEGASEQAVRLWLVDLQGRTITDRQIQVSDSSHQESMSLENHEPGIYLLQVSTPSQSKTIRLLKQ